MYTRGHIDDVAATTSYNVIVVDVAEGKASLLRGRSPGPYSPKPSWDRLDASARSVWALWTQTHLGLNAKFLSPLELLGLP